MTKKKSPPNSASEPASSSNPNASRLRDNQRRSRARKKEYLSTLEAKYQECQKKGVEASIEIQNAARAVVKENMRLKELLRKFGIENEELERWIKEGGLDGGATARVEAGLGAKPCGAHTEGCAASKRPNIAPRRSSTGGIYTKGGALISPAQLVTPQQEGLLSSGSTSPISPRQPPMLHSHSTSPTGIAQRTHSLGTVVYKPHTANVQPTLYNSYPTPSTSATPTSTTTSSPYNKNIPLPMNRGSISSHYTTSQQHSNATTSPNLMSSSSSYGSSLTTTSPPILPGAVNGWNNFPIQPQLPPPALPPAVVNVMYAQHQHQQQPQRRQTSHIRPLLNQHQMQQQYMYQQVQQQQQHSHQMATPKNNRTSCHLAQSLISQFHPEGMNDDLRDEICPSNSINNQPQRHLQSQQHQQHTIQRRQSEPCCGGLIDCGDDDDDDDYNQDDVSEHDNHQGMDLDHMSIEGGVGDMDLNDGRGRVENRQMQCGPGASGACDGSSGCLGGPNGSNGGNGMMGCTVDNAVLFQVLNRIA